MGRGGVTNLIGSGRFSLVAGYGPNVGERVLHMSQPDRYRAGSRQPGQVPVLDTKVRRKRLYADPQVISFGRRSIALDQAEWVSYWAAQISTKRFLTPTDRTSEWDFVVGKYPYYGGLGREDVMVHFFEVGHRDDPEEWTFLVNLARKYLEPRLLTDLVTRVRRGETVTVGASVKVNQHGIACRKPKVSLPWESISTQPYGGMIFIYEAGVEKPVLTVPLRYPNAVLMPALFAAITS
jgi:hypothetical protein